MNIAIDDVVKGWYDQARTQTPQEETEANTAPSPDALVKGWYDDAKKQPHTLDDTYVQAAKNDTGDQSYNNYCETFAEQVAYGRTGLFPTAVDAWNQYAKLGMAQSGDVTQAPKGAMIYFAPDGTNSGEGHVGFSDGQGNFVSATSNGVETIPTAEWIKTTGQVPLGFVLPK